jgi:hypothetical protein
MKFARLALLLGTLASMLVVPGAFGTGQTNSPTPAPSTTYNITCTNGSSAVCRNTLVNCCRACSDLCGVTCCGSIG